ncbi:hypothetical protein AB0B85_32870 [Micromonospora sp. NPDC049044]|uniref:hypothetical protein n=1 Tax=Micromonospora sp. NPDC049044 TaxID=3154827 RepID=UPI0033F98C8F
MKNCNWADSTHADYRSDLVQVIETVREYIFWKANKDWNLGLEADEIENELYAFMFSRPSLITAKLSTVGGTLNQHAKDWCMKLRRQEGALMLGSEALGEILREWHSMPAYIWDVVYGETFSNAAGGRYLALLEQVYRDSRDMLDMTPEELLDPIATMRKLLPAADRKALTRALQRLTEVLGDVMCARPESFDAVKHDQAATDYLAGLDDDETFIGHQGTYRCDKGHEMTARLAVKPPKRLGMPREYGYRNCSCGDKELALAAA